MQWLYCIWCRIDGFTCADNQICLLVYLNMVGMSVFYTEKFIFIWLNEKTEKRIQIHSKSILLFKFSVFHFFSQNEKHFQVYFTFLCTLRKAEKYYEKKDRCNVLIVFESEHLLDISKMLSTEKFGKRCQHTIYFCRKTLYPSMWLVDRC